MKLLLIIFFTFFGFVSCQSQKQKNDNEGMNEKTTLEEQNRIQVEIHSRVDTTNTEIKAIATLWINYLNAEPDKISDNPYWNEKEKNAYRDFDFSRTLLYQYPAENLLRYFKPKILSIEKEGEHYGIRTIFSAEGLEGEFRKSNPWAIQKLYAVKENNEWRLKNALPIITTHWNKKTVGRITFIYPPDHKFNQALADKANQFCNQIASEFQFPEWEPFDFYVTQSGDELGRLLNFDFYFAGYTTGMGLNEKRILLSGFGSEYYPHEFIHLILPKFGRHALIEEGFASWKGGQGGKTFEESAKMFAYELAKNDTVTFSDVLNKKWGWQYSAFYTSGAILCNSAFEKGGIKLVNEILKIPNDTEKLIDNLCLVFKVDKKNFDDFWRSETLKYKD
jgi:hypothetical protein